MANPPDKGTLLLDVPAGHFFTTELLLGAHLSLSDGLTTSFPQPRIGFTELKFALSPSSRVGTVVYARVRSALQVGLVLALFRTNEVVDQPAEPLTSALLPPFGAVVISDALAAAHTNPSTYSLTVNLAPGTLPPALDGKLSVDLAWLPRSDLPGRILFLESWMLVPVLNT